MKKKQIVGTLVGMIAVVLVVLTVLIIPKRVDAEAGTIRFPFYQGTPTMDAARDMICALGWQHGSEGGDGKQVTFRATDRNGKAVAFTFTFHLVGTQVLISAEDGAQFPVQEITKELARRIGMSVGGAPLPEVEADVPTTT
ncbi:hypothetical protein ACFLSJ_08115 [Verrucomicrobiota bacterium]